MFGRLIRRGLWQRKSRALVALVALTVAATLTAAVLNLDLDAQRKIRSEFSRYGANLMLTPAAHPGAAILLDADIAQQMKGDLAAGRLTALTPYLYAVVSLKNESVVLAGNWLDQFARLGGYQVDAGVQPGGRGETDAAWLGASVARRFDLHPGDTVALRYLGSERRFRVAGVLSTGTATDNQILADLGAVQTLANSPGQLNAILARVPGDAASVQAYSRQLAARFPATTVAPIREVTQAEFHVVERIRGAVVGTTLIVLLVTALCVLATMTALALERRRTVGTLKALGASEARLAALFLSESAVLATVASFLGFAAGVALARWLGATLFAATVTLRWATLPLVLGITLAVALVGTLGPLRLVRRTQPAVILRGE